MERSVRRGDYFRGPVGGRGWPGQGHCQLDGEKGMDLNIGWRKTPGVLVGLDVGVRGEEGPNFGACISSVAGGVIRRDRKFPSFPNPPSLTAATRDSSK